MNELATINDKKQEFHINLDLTRKSFENTTKYAIEAGKNLLELKSMVEYGQWGSWVESNLAINIRGVQRLIRVAENQSLVSELNNMTDALELLTEPRNDSAVVSDVIEHEQFTEEDAIQAEKEYLSQQGPYAVVEGQTPEEATEEESIQLKQLQDNQDIREAKAQAAAQRKEINKNNPLSSFEIITAELRNLTESQKAIIAGNIIITVHSNELREIDRSMAERRKMESKKYRRVS